MTAIYAATTIATLQSLTGPFTAGDAADVDGYAAMGDAGGGTFCFEGTAPGSATITNATVSTKAITGATNASPIVITATAHGFTTGQSVLVSGVLGNAAAIGAWLITVLDANTFSLNGSTGNGTWSSGGTQQAASVTVTTSAAHGLAQGCHAMITRTTGTGGFSINGTWLPLGAGTSASTFTIPCSTSGSYSTGGLVGDATTSIPSNAVNGRWLRAGEPGLDSKTTKPMNNINQTLSIAEAANAGIKATGTLTATRRLTFPAPSNETASYERTVHNACTGGWSLTITTGVGQTFDLEPGAKAELEFNTSGVAPVADYVLDPRDFGCPWNGVDDDLPGFTAMIQSLPTLAGGMSQGQVFQIQLPKGVGWFSDDLHIDRPVWIRGHGNTLPVVWGQIQNGFSNALHFAPGKGIVFDGVYSSSNPRVTSADGSTLSDVIVASRQMIPSDEDGIMGSAGSGMALSTSEDAWSALPASVAKGTIALRDGAPISLGTTGARHAYAEGLLRDTTHVVMFRCTTSGTKGTSQPPNFATAGLADISTVINAVGGTAQWTVESVPKDYQNGVAYVVGQRMKLPGVNEHIYECDVAGTSIPLATTTYAGPTVAVNGYIATLNVADTSAFPAWGVVCITTDQGKHYFAYTGKNPESFTGGHLIPRYKFPADAVSYAVGPITNGSTVTGSHDWVAYGVSTRDGTRGRMLNAWWQGSFWDRACAVAKSDDGHALPQATINVDDTSGFASSGTINLWTGSAYTTVTYTGLTQTSFTGCTGGTGTLSKDAEIGQGVHWKRISSGGITVLSNYTNVERVTVLGSSGAAIFLTAFWKHAAPVGGSDFWRVRDVIVYACASGVLTSSVDVNDGLADNLNFFWLGQGHTNTDMPDYCNINGGTWANGTFGNAGTGVRDWLLGHSEYRHLYVQFSGGIPYRNDTLNGAGTLSYWYYLGNETDQRPLFIWPGFVHSAIYGVHPNSSAQILDSGFGRNISTRSKLGTSTDYINTTLGPSGSPVTAGLSVLFEGDPVDIRMFQPTEDFSTFPAKWYAFGVGQEPTGSNLQAFVVPRPVTTVKWPSGASLDYLFQCPLWVTNARIWVGRVSNGIDPSSIGFSSGAAPSSGYYVQGSVAWNNTWSSGGTWTPLKPLGWFCQTSGTPGTGTPGTFSEIHGAQRGEVSVAMNNANATPTAATIGIAHTIVVTSTGAWTADRTLFLPGPDAGSGQQYAIDASAITGGNCVVALVGSVGSTVTIAPGKTAMVRTHATNGVRRQTSDV